jgi:hypothetical protein
MNIHNIISDMRERKVINFSLFQFIEAVEFEVRTMENIPPRSH